MKRFVIAAFLAIFVILLRTEYKGQLNWFDAGPPLIPDVQNADSTVDYAIVGKDLGEFRVLVLRLPKSYKVSRPGAEGIGGTGGGTSFEVAPTSNGSIIFRVKWPGLEDGYAPTKTAGSAVLDDRSVISVSINEITSTSSVEYRQSSIGNPKCLWKPSEFSEILEFAGETAKGRCPISSIWLNEHRVFGFVKDKQMVAELRCQNTTRNKACHYEFFISGRKIYGDFALELLPQFGEIHERLTAFLVSATISNEIN
jgi:hypothetical protein